MQFTFDVMPVSGLSDVHWNAWARIVDEEPMLDSPFFHPEFTRAIAAVREDVEVAVMSNETAPVGFFPFQRGPRGVAQAVGGRLSEFHGVIARPGFEISPVSLLRACGLSAWHFDHLPAFQNSFRESRWGTATSPFIDLSRGFDSYRASRKQSGSAIAQTERKARKLQREIGPLQFEFHTVDDSAFERLTEWKTHQHRRTGMLEIFHRTWVRAMLKHIRATSAGGFAGVFSALSAGDRLVAVHLGLRSRSVLHIWFPSYDSNLAKYSPRTVLLLELARECADRGMKRIDLGRGPERYKQSFKSGDVALWEGSVDRRTAVRAARRAWFGTKRWIRTSRWGSLLRGPLDGSKRLRQWLAFR